MKRVFADTFYFLALLNRRDEAHSAALDCLTHIESLVTTEWVLLELADGLASSKRREAFMQTRQELMEDSNAVVVPLAMDLHLEAIRLYANRSDKGWSLTDCVSFLVMQREGITEALTGDQHFEQAGFVALLK